MNKIFQIDKLKQNNESECLSGGIKVQKKVKEDMHIRYHPCYSFEASKKYARIHLPVAPKCNMKCNYCYRKYDCINESRPGVTSRVIGSDEAVRLIECYINRGKDIKVAGISGPGDPLANPDQTFSTFMKVKLHFPDIFLCLSTNGLNVKEYLNDILAYGIKHVTLTVNMVDPEIGKNIYSYIIYKNKKVKGIEAAEIIHELQIDAIKSLIKNNVYCKINSVVIPGINDFHIKNIANICSELGVYIQNIIPLIPCENTVFGKICIQSPSKKVMEEISKECKGIIRLMHHCKRCRADAIGMLHENGQMDSQLVV